MYEYMYKELLVSVGNMIYGNSVLSNYWNICKICVICDEVNNYILSVGLIFENFQTASCLVDDLFEGRRCFRVLLVVLNEHNPINRRSLHHASCYSTSSLWLIFNLNFLIKKLSISKLVISLIDSIIAVFPLALNSPDGIKDVSFPQ